MADSKDEPGSGSPTVATLSINTVSGNSIGSVRDFSIGNTTSTVSADTTFHIGQLVITPEMAAALLSQSTSGEKKDVDVIEQMIRNGIQPGVGQLSVKQPNEPFKGRNGIKLSDSGESINSADREPLTRETVRFSNQCLFVPRMNINVMVLRERQSDDPNHLSTSIASAQHAWRELHRLVESIGVDKPELAVGVLGSESQDDHLVYGGAALSVHPDRWLGPNPDPPTADSESKWELYKVVATDGAPLFDYTLPNHNQNMVARVIDPVLPSNFRLDLQLVDRSVGDGIGPAGGKGQTLVLLSLSGRQGNVNDLIERFVVETADLQDSMCVRKKSLYFSCVAVRHLEEVKRRKLSRAGRA